MVLIARPRSKQGPYPDALAKLDLRKLYPHLRGDTVFVKCPAHKDKGRPNLAIFPRNSHCFACGFHEGAFEHIRRVRMCETETEVLYVASTLAGDVEYEGTPVETGPLDPSIVVGYVAQLNALQRDPARRSRHWLFTRYGLSVETQLRATIGHNGLAYTIPVYDLEGYLQNIRFRTDPTVIPDPRCKYYGVDGRNQSALYYPPNLVGMPYHQGTRYPDTLLSERVAARYGKRAVVLTEGEFKTLALYQLGIPAVASSNGAQSLVNGGSARLLEQLRGLCVYIAYDQDWVGQYGPPLQEGKPWRPGGAYALYRRLRDMRITVHNVTWDPSLGNDVADLVATGLTKGDLQRIWEIGPPKEPQLEDR